MAEGSLGQHKQRCSRHHKQLTQPPYYILVMVSGLGWASFEHTWAVQLVGCYEDYSCGET